MREERIPLFTFFLISQLNTNTKILSKISANRLKPALPDLVHPDQTGFIPSIERLGNSLRALQIINWLQFYAYIQLCFLHCTDTEKGIWPGRLVVYGRNSHRPGPPLELDTTFHKNPETKVKVNGILFQPLSIEGWNQIPSITPVICVILHITQNIHGVQLASLNTNYWPKEMIFCFILLM